MPRGFAIDELSMILSASRLTVEIRVTRDCGKCQNALAVVVPRSAAVLPVDSSLKSRVSRNGRIAWTVDPL
jgi:bacterioferritin-associated ferredoxin